MTTELGDLYQEVILEHSKAPRNFRRPASANHEAEGYNPLCGDHCSIYIDMEGDKINEIGFQGSGCAISRASASMMTQMVKGKTKAEAVKLFAGEVRHAGVAYAAIRARRRKKTGSRFDRVGKWRRPPEVVERPE